MKGYEIMKTGSVSIGEDFFKHKRRQYADWRKAWFREALQNSVDAGAKNIEISVLRREDGDWNVIVEDDGRGMSKDVLFNKFLVLGGTTKDGTSTTGGFGAAKELLLFPWLSYRLETKGVSLKGHYGNYKYKSSPPRKGVRLKVVMRDGDAVSIQDAKDVIFRSQIPKVSFALAYREEHGGHKSQETMQAKQMKGKCLRSLEEKVKVHAPKTSGYSTNEVWVRVNGLYMFSVWLGKPIKGRQPIVEITGNSVDVLTDNRDGIRDPALRYHLQAFVQEISSDRKSAFRPKNKIRFEIFEGSGKFQLSKDSPEEKVKKMIDVLETKDSESASDEKDTVWGSKRGGVEILEESRVRIASAIGEPIESTAKGALDLTPTASAADLMLKSVSFRNRKDIENAMHPLAWQPDFLIMNETDSFKTPPNLKPDRMSVKVKNLAKFWAETVRFIFMQMKCPTAYGVGWLLEFGDEDSYPAARYMRYDCENWILLNPYKTWKTVDQRNPRKMKASDLFSTSDPDDRAAIYAMAVHEVTHVTSGCTTHDEDFASALTRTMQIAIPGYAKMSGIAKAMRTADQIQLHKSFKH